MSTLTEQQRESFFEDGFLILDTGLPEEVLDGVVSDLDGKYPIQPHPDGVLPPTRIQDAWKESKNAHRVAVAPRLLDALRELYGREPQPFQTLNFPVGTWQPPHSDNVHFSSCPSTFMSGVWVALEDADETNGPVEYYPGSHKLPEFDMSDVGTEPKEELYDQYEKFIAKVIEHFGLERKLATVKKGQAFIWSSNLIHGGSARTDLLKSRHSQVTHVYYEGCKYYTPMLSRGLDICWRHPEWIPLEVKKGLFSR